jgi:hypothetical protein
MFGQNECWVSNGASIQNAKSILFMRVIVLLLSLAARGIKPLAVAFYFQEENGMNQDSNDSSLICSGGTPFERAPSPVKFMMAVGPQDMNVQFENSSSTAFTIISPEIRPCQNSMGAFGSRDRVMMTLHPGAFDIF